MTTSVSSPKTNPTQQVVQQQKPVPAQAPNKDQFQQAPASPTGWEKFKTGCENVGTAIKQDFEWVGGKIEEGAQAAGEGIKHAAQAVGQEIKQDATAVGQGIKHGAEEAWQGLKHAGEVVEQDAEYVGHKIKDAFTPSQQVSVASTTQQVAQQAPASPTKNS